MYLLIKRIFDLILSIIGFIVLSPIFIIVSIWIKIDSPGPVFFTQRRIGKNRSEFDILKFRTMRIDTPNDMPTHLFKNANQFITKSGVFLRKTSLDELPQLINIIRGEMSIVGPRPALWNQYDLISERELYNANNLKPGLTGWAQVNGRDELPITVKAKLDGEYVERQSILFDIKCILMTAFSVVLRRGIIEGDIKKTEAEESRYNEKEDASSWKK